VIVIVHKPKQNWEKLQWCSSQVVVKLVILSLITRAYKVQMQN